MKTSLSFLIFQLLSFFSGDTHAVFIKDLSKEVISEMGNRMEADHYATRCILQSFGIPDHFRGSKFRDISHLFPDTPVKLLRDVCEALQLYDLVDMLEKPIPHLNKTLRPVLTLDEVRKFERIDDRPISYHSRAAVLIFANIEDASFIKSCESFFKSLNNKSEVTIIQTIDLLELALELEQIKRKQRIAKVQRLSHIMEDDAKQAGPLQQPLEQQTKTMKLISELQMQRQTPEQLEKKYKEIEAKERKEKENVETAALTVIDRWIKRQGWCKVVSEKSLGSVSFRGRNFNRDSCFFYRLLRFALFFCFDDAPVYTVI